MPGHYQALLHVLFYLFKQRAPMETSTKEAVSNRLNLRHNLHCHDFKWYLSKVIPEMPIPPTNARQFGQVKKF